MFMLFAKQMEAQGVITRNGSIVDASFVEAPRQRNTREENKEIKEGKTPGRLERQQAPPEGYRCLHRGECAHF